MENYDTFVEDGHDHHTHDSGAPPRPFDSDGYTGFDPRLPSQRFESFQHGLDGDAHEDLDFDAPPAHVQHGFDDLGSDTPPPYRSPFDDDLSAGGDSGSPFHQSFESAPLSGFPPSDGFSQPILPNGNGFVSHGDAFENGETDPVYTFSPPAAGGSLNGAVLPPPEEMQPEEGFILREWRRNNAIRLEEKSKNEREKLSQIIDAADAFKDAFYEKRKLNCETNKTNNRDKEKVFLENLTNFHATADKHYWKAIAELVPHELPAVDSKSRGNKDKKKPSVVINHGPKPGKATDITRMRQVLVKLKHNPPAHMKAPPPPPPAAEDASSKDATVAVPVNPPPPVLEEVAA